MWNPIRLCQAADTLPGVDILSILQYELDNTNITNGHLSHYNKPKEGLLHSFIPCTTKTENAHVRTHLLQILHGMGPASVAEAGGVARKALKALTVGPASQA